MYDPIDGVSNPYLILSIGGRILKVVPDSGIVTDLSSNFGLTNPPLVDQAHFCQAEEFLIIQSGDGVTKPLFWDGVTLRRSKGITNNTVAPGTPGVNEIPAATAMDYYEGRLWYAQGRTYGAGDMVKGPSGTVPYAGRDAILNVTENPLCIGGDNFAVPTNAGNIRALFHNANLNAPLGQGQLFIGTRKAIYAQQVPVSRTDWINASGNNQPVQSVVQLINGPVGDRCIVKINGDIFYQSLEPAIRSLFASLRDFNQWGNSQISNNEERILRFNDRALLRFASGVEFDNRSLQTALPVQTPFGVVHQAIVPLDFDLISTLEEKLPPAWEGAYDGLDILQLFVGDFGGRERAFAMVVSRVDQGFDLWELTKDQRFENGDSRVQWSVETPAWSWGSEFDLRQLQACEIYVDKIFGTVKVQLDYRPDSDPCWRLWGITELCVARNSAETVTDPVTYPIGPDFREGYCSPIVFGKPGADCAKSSCTKRPSDIGHQFQLRITIKGWMRIRGVLVYASPVETGLYELLNACLPASDLLMPVQ